MKRWVLLLGFAATGFADLTQSPVLGDGSYLNLDTGLTATSPGSDVYDLRWTGGSIVPVGKTKLANVGVRTPGQFDLLTESDIKNRLAIGGSASIPAANLVINDVFSVITNDGNASKVMVTRTGSGVLGLTFYTYQSAPPGSPKLTGVLNNSSLIGDGLPNSGIAPSSLFIVRGTGLADPGTPVLQSSAPPGLPLALNGASIAVTVLGVTTRPALYYTSPTQLAAVLPANTPVGSGTLTVTYKGLTSAALPVTVVRSAPGLNYYGANTDVATDGVTGAVLTFLNPGYPGETIVLWATGLGSDPDDSDTTFSTSPHAVNANAQVYIGGIQAQVLYAGSAGYPGVNQINVVIPPSVTQGCYVAVAAVANAVISNVATLPIHAGGGECVDPSTNLKGSQVSSTGGLTFRSGFVSLILDNNPAANGARTIDYTSTAAFVRYTNATNDIPNTVSSGGCILVSYENPPIPGMTQVDAGTITVTGPAGLDVTLHHTLGQIGAYDGTLPTIVPGKYTWKGTGGAIVGSFNTELNLSSLFTWTNPQAATGISRTGGLTVTWTGGNPGSYVLITGAVVQSLGGGNVIRGGFKCMEQVEAGQFTVPAYILSAMPTGGSATMKLQNIIFFPLSADGLDYASGVGYVGYSAPATFATTK